MSANFTSWLENIFRYGIVATLFFPTLLFAQDTLLVVDDPLTNHSTVGKQKGGVFTANGWKTEVYTDYIQYNVETISSGEVQFALQGFYASNEVFPNIEYDRDGNPTGEEDVHYSFFSMWDRDENNDWYGTQWDNPYKCYMHVYGYVPGDQYKWRYMKLRLNVAAYDGGYDDDPHAFEDPKTGPFDWEQDHTYHHRLVWGNGHMRWYMDGEEMKPRGLGWLFL